MRIKNAFYFYKKSPKQKLMTKHSIAFLILCLSYFSAIAQNLKSGGYHKFEVGERSYIVAEKANIRDQPSTQDGKIMEVLPVGTSVEILEKTEESYTSNKITANWCKIQLGYEKEGYVWGGLIAAGWSESEDFPRKLLLYGFNYCELHYGDEPSYYTGNLALKLCMNNTLISQVNFDVQDINGVHELSFQSPDSILFSAKEFSRKGEEALFKNEYLFSLQDQKLQFIGQKKDKTPLLKENGSIPLSHPTYRRFHKIKRYREIALWESRKRPSIPSADYEERTIKIGKRKGYIVENQKFDIQGNWIEDYHYLAEGPLVYKQEYRYLKNPSYPYRIDSIFDKTGLYQTTIHNFMYSENRHRLDSVEIYSIYDGDDKKYSISVVSIEEYRKENPSQEELIYLGDQLRIKKTPYYCYEYFYENHLLKKELVFDEKCQEISTEISYEYDINGLLIGEKYFNPKQKITTEYRYLYDFYSSSDD